MSNPRIVIASTGGTIVSSGSSATQLTGYSLQGLTAEDLVSAVPSLREIADITVLPVCNIGSSNMNEALWVKLALAIEGVLADPDVAGAVVTHGTDTMEETAFFLNLVLKSRKPVVLTGAMRPATALSADGPLNLYNAVRVAACPDSQSRGVLIVMNGLILGARDTTKTNTLSVETFQGRDFGTFGYVTGPSIDYYVAPQSARRRTFESEFLPTDFKDPARPPKIFILYAHAGEDGTLIRAAVGAGAVGIVYAGTGHGSVSEAAERELLAARGRGIEVVRASRTGTGPVLEGKARWQEAGFIPAGTLSPQKARILLELAIARFGHDAGEIRRCFETY